MVYRFGGVELDEQAFELRRDGSPLRVQPKVLKLLLHLVQNRDRVVPTEELLTAGWPDATVAPNSLARAVSLARFAIGQSAAIANVPRRGYRFRGSVEIVSSHAAIGPIGSAYVGRARIRARLEESLDAALGGRGCVLFLTGEAGIGKTRTAELLIERARTRGAFTMTESSNRPWSRILRALRAADPWAYDSLPAVQRRALSQLWPDDRVAANDERVRGLLLEASRAFIVRAAGSRPIAILLDDLHDADTESLWLLENVSAAIASVPVAIIATGREAEIAKTERRARALERLYRASTLERWSLEGLGSEEVGEFVRSALGRVPQSSLVLALERQTNGNPLLLRESLRSLEARDLLDRRCDAAEWEALLPTSIRHLLGPKLRPLKPGALEILACAAALGLEADRELLARLVRDSREFERELSACVAAGLLFASVDGARVRFSHLLVREAVYAELVPPGEARHELHARAARALEVPGSETGDALTARAHHACEAAPRIPAQQAAALAEAAADQAIRRLDFDAAVVWAERALGVLERGDSPDPAARAQILLTLGIAQTQAHGVEPARVSYRLAADQARSVGRPDLFARAALGFAHRPNGSGHGDRETIALLEEAARMQGVDESTATRVRSRLAAELRYAEPERSRQMSDDALAAARRQGDSAVLAQTLDDCSFVRISLADPEGWLALNAELVRAARSARELELELLGHKGCVTGLLELGDMKAVDRELRALERTARLLGTPYARWLHAALLAMRSLLDGDLSSAERHIVDSGAWGANAESPDVALELEAQLAYLRFEQGRSDEIEEALRLKVRTFPDAPAWRAALAGMLAATNRRSDAARELAQLARHDFRDIPLDRGWLPTLAFAAQVTSATGDERAAAALYEQLSPHARLSVIAGSGLLYFGPVAHFLGLTAAALSRWDSANQHFEHAVAVEERVGARVWKAHSEIAWARTLLARGAADDRARAVELAGRAEAAASACGWPALAAEALPLASRSWARSPRPPSSKRARQRRVPFR